MFLKALNTQYLVCNTTEINIEDKKIRLYFLMYMTEIYRLK